MVKIVCPNCAADLDIPIAPIHTCDYCGTAIQVSVMTGPEAKNVTGQEVSEEAKNSYIIQDHFLIRCQYTAEAAKSLMIDWVSKIPGAPENFGEQIRIDKINLKFYPMWVGEYTAASDYVGVDDWPNFHHPAMDRPGWFEGVTYSAHEEKGHVLREYQIPLLAISSEKIPKYLQSYIVTSTGKEYFDIKHVKNLGGEIIDSIYTFDQIKTMMNNETLNRQTNEFRKEVKAISNRQDTVTQRGLFYIQFPVYEITYVFNNFPYSALIDGSNGRIIHVDMPLSLGFKLKSSLMGLLGIIPGIILLILAFSIDSIKFFGLTGGIGLIIIGIMFFAMNFRKGAEEKQK
jgi:hypothetical protein